MKTEIMQGLPTPEEYRDLRASAGWKLLDANAMAKGVASSVYGVIAKQDGKTVGMGRIVGDGGIIHLLADIIVMPEFQGMGIGRAIILNLMDWIQTTCVRDSLVWLFSAEGKEGFYEKFGFKRRPSSGMGSGMQWYWRDAE